MPDNAATVREVGDGCARAAEMLAGTPGEAAKAAERLRAVSSQVEKTAGLFFVKSRLAASFVVTLRARARALEEVLGQVSLPEGAAASSEDWQTFLDALEAIEKEANILHAKATSVQQMMIT